MGGWDTRALWATLAQGPRQMGGRTPPLEASMLPPSPSSARNAPSSAVATFCVGQLCQKETRPPEVPWE